MQPAAVAHPDGGMLVSWYECGTNEIFLSHVGKSGMRTSVKESDNSGITTNWWENSSYFNSSREVNGRLR